MMESARASDSAEEEPFYMTIDQGGSSSKALVFDRQGGVVSRASTPVSSRREGPNRVEQDPVELLDSIGCCLEMLAEDLGGRIEAIEAAGLATQRSSVVCWDRETGEPLSPVLSWQDRRAEALVRGLGRQERRVREISGLMLSSHYGAGKIRWCLDHLTLVDRARKEDRLACGPLASFLLFRLCRERPFVVDPAIAARTLLCDVRSGSWSPELLEWFGVPRSVLPETVASRHEFGHIELRRARIPLTVSTGDQSAALFADGTPRTESVSVNLGTGAFLQRLVDEPRGSRCRLLDSLVWRDGRKVLRALEGSINGCGSALAEVGGELGIESGTLAARVDEWLARRETPPLFLNGVSGLGSPYWVADYPTDLVGSGEPWQIMVAVLESIVFLLQVNLEEMSGEIGPARRIEIAGGLASSAGLCQRVADLSGCDVMRSDLQEATARGLAFLLAGEEALRPFDKTEQRFTPSSNLELEARYRRWRQRLESRLPDSRGLRA